ncbi:MAG: hypothetical protein ACTS53_01090 [Candidatus Hodgkinia cicadicola]
MKLLILALMLCFVSSARLRLPKVCKFGRSKWIKPRMLFNIAEGNSEGSELNVRRPFALINGGIGKAIETTFA